MKGHFVSVLISYCLDPSFPVPAWISQPEALSSPVAQVKAAAMWIYFAMWFETIL